MTGFEMIMLGIVMGMLGATIFIGLVMGFRKDKGDEGIYKGESDEHSADNLLDSGIDRMDWGNSVHYKPTTEEEVINALQLLRMAMTDYERAAIDESIKMWKEKENEGKR